MAHPVETSGTPELTAEASAFPRRTVGALLGLLSGAVAIGVAQLAAGIVGGASSPIVSVGGSVIDATPEWLKSFAIRTFGTADKVALLIGIGVLLVVAAVVLGVASVRRPWVAMVGLVVLGAVGAIAAVTRPANGPGAAIPSLAGAVAGIVAYLALRRAAGLPSGVDDVQGSGEGARREPEMPRGFDRRRFLWSGAAAAGVAVVSGRAGEWLIRWSDANSSRAAVEIPRALDTAGPIPAGADLDIPGLGPFLTPNDRFYRVDTALLVPSVSADGWTLRVHGSVDHPLTLTYDQLASRPLIERDITLTCVSNEVGGPYVGNARWVGAPLQALLEEVGVQPGATQLVSRSADGFTAGTPTAVAMDGRDAMLAISMNGEPLPLEHGFPVRMIVPGLYGYVSATKWLVELELTTFEAFDPYWAKRGWAKEAPIKTGSRIDTPRSSDRLTAGQIAIAGVAWAQNRGIDGVEVRVDEGPWLRAELAAEDTMDTWRQWVLRWDATSGPHVLTVRATDGSGVTQTDEEVPPFPDGATGHHSITVDVV